MRPTRVYHVKLYDKDHLVEAITSASAARHVLQKNGRVLIASQMTIIDLMKKGVTLEKAVVQE